MKNKIPGKGMTDTIKQARQRALAICLGTERMVAEDISALLNTLCDELTESNRQRDVMREALRYYADESNYYYNPRPCIPVIDDDSGERAQRALALSGEGVSVQGKKQQGAGGDNTGGGRRASKPEHHPV